MADPVVGAFPSKRALTRLEQPWNALAPMLVTLAGTVTPVRLVLPANAEAPMLVTVKPLIVPGMVTGPLPIEE